MSLETLQVLTKRAVHRELHSGARNAMEREGTSKRSRSKHEIIGSHVLKCCVANNFRVTLDFPSAFYAAEPTPNEGSKPCWNSGPGPGASSRGSFPYYKSCEL